MRRIWIVIALICIMPVAVAGQGDTLFAQAKAAADAKDYNTAIVLYEQVLTSFANHPRAPEAGMGIGYCDLKLNDRDAALLAFKYVADTYGLSPLAPEAKRSVANCYVAKKDPDAAIKEFSELVAQYPTSEQAPPAQMRIGYLYINKRSSCKTPSARNKCRANADDAFKTVVELFPKAREICAQAELQRAGIAFENALDKKLSWQEAESKINEVLAAYSDAPTWIRARLNLMLAESALEQKDPSLALKRAEEIVTAFPECKREVGWAEFVSGNAAEKLFDYSLALTHYTAIREGGYTAADNFKDRDIVLYSLVRSAECRKNLAQVDKAGEIWQQIIQQYPGTPEAKRAADIVEGRR